MGPSKISDVANVVYHIEVTDGCRDHVYPFMRIVFPQDGGLYQQDIAECHTTDSVRAWFKEHQDQFIVLPCPENSPDLSPINNLWNPLDRVVRVMDPHARNLVQQ
ncbi:transposable element Tcb1 transposase [Trichonephila clavipes]|nr:transposable element Tcb1 transposase [Trichonephila clavipes]